MCVCETRARSCPPRLLGAWAVFAALAAGGCASWGCQPRPPDSPLLAVWYSSGGPGPYIATLTLTAERVLRYETPRGRIHCGRLDSSDYESLVDLVNREAVRRSAEHAAEEGRRFVDYESITIETPAWTAGFPLHLAPAEVRELLRTADGLLQKHFHLRPGWAPGRTGELGVPPAVLLGGALLTTRCSTADH